VTSAGSHRSPIPATVPIEPLAEGAPPLAILVDYDGTIALTDVGDVLMAELKNEQWETETARYDAGLVGSRRLMEWEIGLWHPDPGAMSRLAAEQPHDPDFATVARRARAAGIPVEVVSDGFGFFIEPALDRLGVGDVPVVTALTEFSANGAPSISFPNGHPTCFVCGTCKRNRVLGHQRAGRAVAFVGDGASDRYAAGYSDVVFAKEGLEQLCVAYGWPYRRWTRFAEIDAWLTRVLDAWHADPQTPDMPRPVARPFFCGPEVWGDGRWDPPPPNSPRA
jgi:2-hydroxy-3-keto-5-methylthiopentenyl-1-phosphate phosphatase